MDLSWQGGVSGRFLLRAPAEVGAAVGRQEAVPRLFLGKKVKIKCMDHIHTY